MNGRVFSGVRVPVSRRRIARFGLGFGLACGLWILSGPSVAGGDLSIQPGLIAGGGGQSRSSRFAIMGSVGQPLADSDAEPGDGFAVRSGYWSQVLRWINIPPVPTEDSVSRAAGAGVRILIGTLIANDIDGDFDALSFAGFGPRSANGANVTRDGLSLIYSLPPGGDPGGDDVVTYFVSDGDSPPVAGILRVLQGTLSNEQEIALDPGLPPRVRLQFRGVPGRAYRLEAATALQVSWRDLGSFTADSNGQVEFSEVVAASTQFYRWVER